MEIVTLERSLVLNVQGKRSEVDYLRAFKANANAINLAGGYAGDSIAAAKLVAKEQGLNYEVVDSVKQETISPVVDVIHFFLVTGAVEAAAEAPDFPFRWTPVCSPVVNSLF